jgi:hypothetical protein
LLSDALCQLSRHDPIPQTIPHSPPVLRRKSDGTLAFDYHIAEGALRTRMQLMRMLQSYEAWLQPRKKTPNQPPLQTPTSGTPAAAQPSRQP